jgi:capsular polysaccharide biosynthesis protein
MDNLLTKRPIDYVRVIFRRKWLIIIPLVFGIIAGIVAANTLPKIYESSTLMLVEEGRVINPLIQGLAVSSSVAQRLQILREQMLGWDRINQLISKLDLAKEVTTQQEFEDLVKALRKNIKVTLYGQNIIRISYQGEDPLEAMNIVKTITDIFIAENLRQQNRETENAIAFINDQLELYQRKVKESEIAKMEEKLDTLLLDSTEKHPMVISLRKEIEAAKSELNQGIYNVKSEETSASDNEVEELKEELQSIREELSTSSLEADQGGENRAKLAAKTNEKLYKLLLIERVEQATAKDAGVNQRLYNELLQRLETAKITQRLEASKEGTRYVILDPAGLPLRPVKPNKLLVLMMGMFMGVCGGGGLIFTSEMFDHSLLGVEEAKSQLDLPVLGGIPKITTNRDIRGQKLKNFTIGLITLIVGAGLAVIIVFNIILGS